MLETVYTGGKGEGIWDGVRGYDDSRGTLGGVVNFGRQWGDSACLY